MRYQTFCAAALASAGLLIAGASAAHAAEISSVQLEAAVLDGEGQPITSRESGAAYWYTFNYSITGADLTGVGATITVDLPEGLWAYEQNAPAAFASSCTQAGGNQWKFTCEFTSADLDINTAGGIAGQARVLVRSRRFFLAHGDSVTATAQLTASYTDAAGDPAQMTANGQHTMAFTATPAISGPTVQTHSTVAFSGLGSPYYPMTAPNGEHGVAYKVRWNAGNTGTARIDSATLDITLPDGFMIAGSGGWTRTTDLWTPGVARFTRTNWGIWTALNSANSPVGTFGNSVIDITMFAPCSVLANTRLEDGSVPPGMQMNGTLTAEGYGVIYADEDDQVGVVATHTLSRAITGSAPDFTNYSCDGDQALFHKLRQSSAGTEAGATSGWYLRATVPFGATYLTDAVVWDALDPSVAEFTAAEVNTPTDGPFTRYLCDLTGLTVDPPTARADFLGSWKDDPSRCYEDLPEGGSWGDVTHVFFHAPLWGEVSPDLTGGYTPPLHYFFLRTRAPVDAQHNDVLSNTAWFEADETTLRERTATHFVSDVATPVINGGANSFSIGAINAPFVTPGEPVTFGVRPYRSGSVLPLNPVVAITLPPGLLYDGSTVSFGSGCVTAESEGASAPGTWVPLDYTAAPVVTPGADGALVLTWSFGSEQHPFRLNGGCPNVSGVTQVRIDLQTTVNPNLSYANGQAVTFTARMTSANQGSASTGTYDLRVQVPGEMRVEVVPWCEAQGRIGFNSVYENSGGVDLTNVAVVFPIPEQFDPNGTPLDVAHFVDADFADPAGAVEYSTDGGATWLADPPADLTTVDVVRLLIPTLPANSGPQGFYVNIEVPAGNPGDNQVHAAASMEADQLTDASSPVSIPFVVNTCPKPLRVSKFFDTDGDGVWDDGEPPLRGWRFEVRDGDVLVASGATNAAGDVTFTLTQGTYTVTELLPADSGADGEPTWASTTGGLSQTVFVGLTEDDYHLVFGNTCACAAPDSCSVALCDPVQGCLVTPRSCDDGNACTADSCDAAANPVDGCVNAPVAPGAACDDGDACTLGETCDAAGACVPADTVSCLAEGTCIDSSACNPATGICEVTYASAGAVCEGGNLCQSHACDGQGGCVAGASVSCDDSNACTADSCDPASGCVNVPVEAGASCSDDDLCTLGDQCDGAGVCVGRDVECNDHGLCQEPGTCDPATGECTYAQAPCYLANFWTAVADADGRVLGSIKCGFDAQGEPVCDTHADGSLVIYDELPCVAAAGTATLPSDGAESRPGPGEKDDREAALPPVGEQAALPASPEADPAEPTEAP